MSEWPHFAELPDGMDNHFMTCLVALRKEMGFPFIVTSSLRNDTRNSLHNYGKAIDLNIYYERAFKLVEAAPAFGFVGIGISQSGPTNKRFIHLDTGGEGFPRPRVWSY